MSDWNLVAVLKIMPESPETNLDFIKKSFTEIAGSLAQVHTVKEVPIAFGLIAIELTLLMNDKQGGIEEIQEKISALEGVGEVEVLDLNRL
ncbi:MAG TPA: elongation factor 1-beta [Candidatus Altiarchaeales archaeon]|nr:elongation factor 1-beta [Candidatus Altiarchaeales archaeon]